MHAFVDGILMTSGEGGKDQLAGVGLAVAHRHLGTPLEHLFNFVDTGEVQLWVYPLREHVHSQGDHVYVAGTLSVAEEGSFYPVGSGQQSHLRGGDAAAPVVMGMEGDNGAVPPRQGADEVFQHISELVGHTVFHGGGQVENHLVFRRSVEVVQHRLTDFHRVVHLGAHKRFRRVFKAQIHTRFNHGLRHLIDEVGGIGGNFCYALAVHVKHHFSLEGGGGVVKVKNHVFCSLNGFEGLFNQMFPGLNQHLDGHIVRDVPPLDQFPANLILRLAGGGKPNFNFFYADVHQCVEIFQFLSQIHGVYQRLIAVTQIDGAPDGSLGDDPVGPGTAPDRLRLKGNVLFKSWFHSLCPPYKMCVWMRQGTENAPDFFKSGACKLHAVPPWFGWQLPDSPHSL